MQAHEVGGATVGTAFADPRSTRIGVVVGALAVAAMAVDHLMGDDPGLEDPPAFLIGSALSLVLAAYLFGRFVPRVAPGRAARTGLVLSVVAVVPGAAMIWLGLPFVVAGAGLALAMRARRESPGAAGRSATVAVAVGALVVLGASVAYVVEAVEKLL